MDCEWSGWREWGVCSKTCNEGEKAKYRSKTITEEHGGTCTGQASETETCIATYCPRNRNYIFLKLIKS